MITRLLSFALVLSFPLAAQAKGPAARPARAPAAAQVPGMVSSADPRASAAGVEILRAGGTATDAAIATMLARNVVEPQNSGIGGGAFLVHHDARSGAVSTIDGREAAPAAANGHWVYVDGKPLSHFAAIPGGRSVGVPGALRLMALAHQLHGRLPWARLFQPALRLARDGFVITPRLHNGLHNFGTHVDAWTKAHFSGPDGQPLPAGTLLKSPA